MASFKAFLAISSFSIFLLLILPFGASSTLHVESKGSDALTRNSFPKGFIFGACTTAYQYEGAANVDGRGPSIWDTFTHQHPEKIADQSNGDVALDFYHRYKDDIKSVKEMGLDSFRISLSWPRILPKGRISGGINRLGIQFYNNLIDELLANGIEPFVTIYNWDLPQVLEDEYGGFLSPKIVDDFLEYAHLVLMEFGDRVKYWTTLNNPNIMTQYGYATGLHAPGRCSNHIGNCSAGDSSTEPYVVAHHLLLSHASTVQLYRNKFQASQNGTIGIAIAGAVGVPINNTTANNLASLRNTDFTFGWFVHPVVFGEYPETMRHALGNRLPKFTEEQSALLRQSFDFIGLNYFSSYYVTSSSSSNQVNPSYTTDSRTIATPYRDGIPIGDPSPLAWVYVYPEGLTTMLHYMKEKYNDPYIFITETGVGQANNEPLETALNDTQRITYLSSHLSYLRDAIKEGAIDKCRGYFVWSWMDDFEWGLGYTNRMGLNYVDFDDDLKRYPKASFYWLKQFLAKETMMDACMMESTNQFACMSS